MIRESDRVCNGEVYRKIDFDSLDGKSMVDVLLFLESECGDLATYCKEPLEFVFETSYGELERTGIKGTLE